MHSIYAETFRFIIISQLKLMDFDTNFHTHTEKKCVLKYSIKIKYQQNIDYNQTNFHNIIADITVIISKM